MASYYSQVEDAIKKNEKELAHLQDELKGLRSVEKDTPRESYQREHERILYHMDQEQKRLEENRNLLSNYNDAYANMSKLKELRELREQEQDPETMGNLDGQIFIAERNLTANIQGLTDELKEELNTSFSQEENEEVIDQHQTEIIDIPEKINESSSIEPSHDEADTTNIDEQENIETITDEETQSSEEDIDQREIDLQEELSKAEEEYNQAEQAYRNSIAELQRIFDEERTRREEGPFATEEELNSITSDYMRQKIEENERFEDARARMRKAERRITAINEKAESYADAKEKAENYGISVDNYEKIKKTAESKDVLSAVYEQKGLGEVSKESEEGKETATAVSEEVVEKVIEQLKQSGIVVNQNGASINQEGIINQNGAVNINIIDSINIIYGTDIPVKDGDSRTITITPDEKEQVKNKIKVKVKKVPRPTEEQVEQTPGKAPEGVPIKTEDNQTNLVPSEKEIESNEPTIPIADEINPSTIGEEASTPNVEPTEEETKTPNIQSTTEGETNKNNPEDINEIPRGINPDGTYRLTRDEIIQDDTTNNNQSTKRPTSTISNPGDNNQQKPPIELPPHDKPLTLPPHKDPIGLPPHDKPLALPPHKDPIGLPPHKENPPVKPKEPQKTPKRGLLTIMDELTSGLTLTKKDGKRYKASNIKVAENFKNELKSGNYLYNIVHLVPSIVKLPFQLLQKAAGKIMFREESKKNIKALKERISKLSEDDLMTIYTEYRGSRVNQERFPSILNTLLDERLQKFALDKVTAVNSDLEQRYNKAFYSIKQLEAIDTQLNNPSLSQKDKDTLRGYRTNLLKGQADNIKAIREGYIDANGWLSGGIHGFSEDMKAAATKLSCVGKRFAKDYDLDNELLRKQALLEQIENQAIANGDNEKALRTFVAGESLLSSNTEISNSVFGKRSTGKKYYSPLAEKLDYRNDPFVRDLFTTIAVTSAAISAANAINTHMGQNDIQQIIDQNNQTMDQVNQIGRDIAGKRDVMMEGMKAQGTQGNLTAAGEIERGVLDSTDWSLGSGAYRTADNMGHEFYNDFYEATQTSFQDVASKYASGAITEQQAMDLIADISARTQSTLGSVTQECLNIIKPYAQANPQFDLTGVQGAMEYLVQNPTAITEMNQAMVDVTAAGDVLAGLQFQQLAQLPSDLRTTLFAAASSAALATNVSNTMTENTRKGKYGNDVTAMVDEYVNSQETPEQSKSASK